MRMTVFRHTVGLVLTALALAVPSAARGEEPLVDEARCDDVLAKPAPAADVSDPGGAARGLYAVARCEERLGRVASAVLDYEETARRASSVDEPLASAALGRARELRPRAPQLLVTLQGDGSRPVTVMLDGRPVTGEALRRPLLVDPGSHRVEVWAPGRAPMQEDVVLVEGERGSISMPLGPRPRDAQGPIVAQGSRRVAGVVLLGSGVALGAASLVFMFRHSSRVDELMVACPNGNCPEARQVQLADLRADANRDQLFSVALAGGAVTSLVAGAYLLLTTSESSSDLLRPPRSVSVAPTLGGAALTGSF